MSNQQDEPQGYEMSFTGRVHFFDLMDRYPIYENLHSVLPLKSVINLSATCTRLRTMFRSQFDLDNRLLRFVKDPLRFRSQLGEYGSVISGSFALQFFARTLWSDASLDIMVDSSEKMARWAAYLEQEEGYMPDASADPSLSETYWMFLENIRGYRRPLDLDPLGLKIQILWTTSNNIKSVLSGSFVTATVNFISWNKAYALFPQETFCSQKMYRLRNDLERDEASEQLLRKYNKHGWTLGCPRDEHDTETDYFRRIGDQFTWTINLPTEGVAVPAQPDAVIESSTFLASRVDWVTGRVTPTRYHIDTQTHHHISLKYTYVLFTEYPRAIDKSEWADKYALDHWIVFDERESRRWHECYEGYVFRVPGPPELCRLRRNKGDQWKTYDEQFLADCEKEWATWGK